MKLVGVDEGDLGGGPLEDAVWELEHYLGEIIGKIDEVVGFAEKTIGVALTRQQKQELIVIKATVDALHSDSKASYAGLRKFVEANRVEAP